MQHRERHDGAEARGLERHRGGIPGHDLDALAEGPLPEGFGEVRIDLYGGEARHPCAEQVGGQSGPGTDLQHLIAQLDPIQHPWQLVSYPGGPRVTATVPAVKPVHALPPGWSRVQLGPVALMRPGAAAHHVHRPTPIASAPQNNCSRSLTRRIFHVAVLGNCDHGIWTGSASGGRSSVACAQAAWSSGISPVVLRTGTGLWPATASMTTSVVCGSRSSSTSSSSMALAAGMRSISRSTRRTAPNWLIMPRSPVFHHHPSHFRSCRSCSPT